MSSILIPIDDGYTLDATVKTRGWPDVAVSYRPALPLEVVRFLQAPRETPEQTLKAHVDLCLKHLCKWDVADDSGDRIAHLDEATLRRVPFQIHKTLADLITGYAKEQDAADQKN